MESRLDIDVFGNEKGFRLGAILLHDHQPQAAIVLDVPGPWDELEPHATRFQDRLGVHGLMRRVEEQDEVSIGQVHPSRARLGFGHRGFLSGDPGGPTGTDPGDN